MNCAQALNVSLHALLRDRADVYLLGEDLLDPYGGAFKITRGLSTAFPNRVLTTPISEAAIVGVAAGMAMRGLVPIVEIMFGDFVALCMDQLLNHATKFPAMYNGQVGCHFVLRTPMGGYRGYGPTHSQTLDKFLTAIPGLTVLAPSHLHALGDLLTHAALHETGPVAFIENKQMYARENDPVSTMAGPFAIDRGDSAATPTLRLSLTGFEHADVTLVTYGGMLPMVMDAATDALLEAEINAEIIVPSRLSPLNIEPILASLARTGRLVTVEEGTHTGGIGAEIVSHVAQRDPTVLRYPARLIAATAGVIPSAGELEAGVLPSRRGIVQAIVGRSVQAIARAAA